MLITDSVTLERTAYPLETKGTTKMRLIEYLNLMKTLCNVLLHEKPIHNTVSVGRMPPHAVLGSNIIIQHLLFMW
jgi:hypothetical protein